MLLMFGSLFRLAGFAGCLDLFGKLQGEGDDLGTGEVLAALPMITVSVFGDVDHSGQILRGIGSRQSAFHLDGGLQGVDLGGG